MAANIINNTTGQTGYQIPGATIPTGFTSMSVSPTMDASKIQSATGPIQVPTESASQHPAEPVIAGATASLEDAARQQATKDVEKESAGVTASQKASQGLLGSVKDIMSRIAGVQTSETETAQPGIAKETGELNIINKETADTTVKMREELKALQARGDIAQGAKAGLEFNIKSKYGDELANLAIRQTASSGNLERLNKALKDSIELKTAPLQTDLNYYKDFAIKNQNDLTAQEQTKMGQIIAEKNDILTRKSASETAKATLLTEALKQGVKLTDAQVQGIQNSPDGATAAAYLASQGVSLVNPAEIALKEAQAAKLWADVREIAGKTKTNITPALAQAATKTNIETVDSLIDDTAIRSAVGPTGAARFIGYGLDTATGARQNYIAQVEQLRSQLSLDSLIRAKAQGATFGALSDPEMAILSKSASKLSTWAMVDPTTKEVTGYKANESDFKKELERINNFAKLDYIYKGGSPEEVGAQKLRGNTIWVMGKDRKLNQIN